MALSRSVCEAFTILSTSWMSMPARGAELGPGILTRPIWLRVSSSYSSQVQLSQARIALKDPWTPPLFRLSPSWTRYFLIVSGVI